MSDVRIGECNMMRECPLGIEGTEMRGEGRRGSRDVARWRGRVVVRVLPFNGSPPPTVVVCCCHLHH
jgi:hypothetical protein